jgi:glucans biosynthesis protein
MQAGTGKFSAGLILLAVLSLLGTQSALAFGFNDVVKMAKSRAAKAYQAPPSTPSFLKDLSYDQFRKIRFNPADSLWHESHSRFQVMLVAPGLYFKHIVNLHVVDAAGTHSVAFKKKDFSWPNDKIKDQVSDQLGYAGFKLTYPLNGSKVHNQFLVFAGVSYFRGVARDEHFGLSARGIAIDTGLASGEEFPIFTDFWLVRPNPTAKSLRFYALLDGPSLTGAYQFVVRPGAPTRIHVTAKLFPRQDIKLLGFAPLTSMFYYGRNTPRPIGMWRGAIHDSDGLLIHSGTGEWLWHPLTNPVKLETEYFDANSPKGFGLMQRERSFRVYQDAEARYDLRPSAWVKPHNDWGKGHVVLVKLPTDSETNDNIVAFWSPSDSAKAGDHYDLDYTLSLGRPSISAEPVGSAHATLVGTGNKKNQYRFIVDFGGGNLDKLSHDASVKAVVSGLNGAKVLQQSVEWVGALAKWRLSFLVQAPSGKNLNLRAYLTDGNKTLTETWSYTLSPDNRFVKHGG